MMRILVAAHHDVVRTGVRTILADHEGWEVVGEARNGKEAIQQALALRPDLVVLDYAMPLVNGVEVTRQIKGRCTRNRVEDVPGCLGRERLSS